MAARTQNVRVWNKGFYSVDYDSLDVSIGYRGKRLGSMSSYRGGIRARQSSYVNATLQLDAAEVLSDAIYLIQDLARGSITFDTESEGSLGFSSSTCQLRLKYRVKSL